jgi:tRNA modification GTPase
MSFSCDTIAAVATAPGRGGVAVIRISGADAFAVAEKVCRFSPEEIQDAFPCVRRARFFNPSLSRVVDNGLALFFKSPRSYTGEDVVELQCHGGAVAPRSVLEAALHSGARLARRGEFTERAFLNGKLDYAQAEGVLSMVDALTERAACAALDAIDGKSAENHRALYEEAVRISSVLEHALDVSEDELPEDFISSQIASISRLRDSVKKAAVSSREGKILREGARVVLSGAPNVGKSSLFNALLNESRAIVSATPGTTRDSIESWMDICGWPICLVDTAGLRATPDEIEKEGVRRAVSLAESAHIVLELEEYSSSAAPFSGQVSSAEKPCKIKVFTKADLQSDLSSSCDGAVLVSSKTGQGIDKLKDAISSALGKIAESSSSDFGDVSADRLQEVAGLLDKALSSSDIVLIANDVRTVAERLAAIVGAVYSEDLLESLFSRFCVGK